MILYAIVRIKFCHHRQPNGFAHVIIYLLGSQSFIYPWRLLPYFSRSLIMKSYEIRLIYTIPTLNMKNPTLAKKI
ncbi:hypothetical protein L6452_21213 [Arctium lappa]|uniref:Uncharacterized protein n=1 Tax=Arctium lappa TaxID=4217 RepID=A0ACB9BE00_ARCLA|nr:hypothetical protein L6452_21213 [Arctium lappa]